MQNNLYIRTDEGREEFVKANEIVPIFRRLLGVGEILKCACKNPVEKEIYFFEVIHKKTKIKHQLFTASNCGKKILKLAGKEVPPLFTLFRTESKNSKTEKAELEGGHREQNLVQFCPLNQELYDAIGILCSSWDLAFPDGPLLEMLMFLIKAPGYPTKDWAIEKFNGIVGKDTKERTLMEMLESLKEEGRQLKNFEFPLMNAIIDNSNLTNNISK